MTTFRRSLVACIVPLALCGSFPALGAPSSVAKGEDLFRERCLVCHAIGCNRTGPKLKGVIGRKAGSLADFSGYSEGLKSANWTWSEDMVSRWIENPSKLVPGTRMTGAFRNVENARERRLIIQYVKRADTSLDLCGVRRN